MFTPAEVGDCAELRGLGLQTAAVLQLRVRGGEAAAGVRLQERRGDSLPGRQVPGHHPGRDVGCRSRGPQFDTNIFNCLENYCSRSVEGGCLLYKCLRVEKDRKIIFPERRNEKR